MSAGAALQDVGDPQERLAVDQETLQLAIEHRELALVIRARQRLVFDQLGLGDAVGADREIETLELLVENLPARWRWPAELLRAMCAVGEARWQDVSRHVERATSLLGSRLDPGIDRCLRLRAFFESVLANRDAALDDTWRAAAAVFSQRPIPEICSALVHARLGRIDEARAALASASREAVIAFAADPPTSVLICEVAAALDDAALAAELEPRVVASASSIAVWSWLAMSCLGPVSRGLALLARTQGRFDDAERWFADAEHRVARAGLRLHSPRLGFERGEARLRAGDRPAGLALLERARVDATRLGMSELVDRIDRLCGAAPSSREPAALVVRRDGELWEIALGEVSARLKDSRGLQMLGKLVDVPEREIHVLELATASGEPIDAGDSGEVVDERARAEYRQRIVDLREALDDAEARHHAARADVIREELELLEAELMAAVGLGGRLRRTGGAAERARINVQRRLTDAIRRVAEVAPAIGAHLKACVRTGVYCRYSPASPRGS